MISAVSTQLSSQLVALNNDKLMGFIGDTEANVRQNNLNNSVLKLANNLAAFQQITEPKVEIDNNNGVLEPNELTDKIFMALAAKPNNNPSEYEIREELEISPRELNAQLVLLRKYDIAELELNTNGNRIKCLGKFSEVSKAGGLRKYLELQKHSSGTIPKFNTSNNTSKIYFSYAWNDQDNPHREVIVQDLYHSLKSAGFDVRRDKENAGYRASIRDFMQEIGQGHCIIVVISDKYLKSENCMFEMYEIYRNAKLEKGSFYDKIFPVRVENLGLNQPKVLMNYFKFWQDKEKEWEELIVTFGTRITSEQQDQYRRVKEIAHELGDFLAFLNDMNAQSKEELSSNNFEIIKKAIIKKTKG